MVGPLGERMVPAMTIVTSQPLTAIQVAAVMHEGVIACDKDTPLREVAALMSEHQVHCVVVIDDEDARCPWGLISDLDLAAAAGVRGLDGQTAGGTAATPVVMVSPGETLERGAQLMTEHGVSHLVVADSTTLRPVGVLSTLDVARAAAVAA
jgi:CBS domain-containing protein